MPFFSAKDGLRLAYDDHGAGPVLLCLPGLTRNMADFDPVLDRFVDRARILRMDLRGRGASDFDPDWHNYNILHESRDVIDLLDHLGLDKAAILGTSRGGLIALTLGVGHHDRLSGVLFNDIGPVVEPAGLAHIMSYLGMPPPYGSMADAVAGLPEAMAQQGFHNVSADGWAAYARRLWSEGPDGALRLTYDTNLRHAVLEQSADGALPEIWPLFHGLDGLPVGLIRGANSDLLSPATAARMRAARPDMLFAEVPDRGHVPFLDEPEAVALTARFLERLP